MTESVQQLDRHDRRRLSEAFFSVQSAANEVRNFFQEIAAPSDDATPGEIVEVLLASTATDVTTLERAMDMMCEVVASFNDHYGERAFDMEALDEHMPKMTSAVKDVKMAIDRAVVAVRLGSVSTATDTLLATALANESACRELVTLTERVCLVFGVATRAAAATAASTAMPMLSLGDEVSGESSFDSNDDSEDAAYDLTMSMTADFIAPSEDDSIDWKSALVGGE